MIPAARFNLAFLCGSFWKTTKSFDNQTSFQGQNEKEPKWKIRSIDCIQNVFVLLPCLYLNSSSLECYPGGYARAWCDTPKSRRLEA